VNRYRVRLPLTVHLPGGTYEQGDEFDHEFTEEDEDRNVASGLLEIVPRTYKVVGVSVVDGHQPGETFAAAIPLGREALLTAGGHIERVQSSKSTPQPEHQE
jgi:uncharacterized protein (DUF2344 family)